MLKEFHVLRPPRVRVQMAASALPRLDAVGALAGAFGAGVASSLRCVGSERVQNDGI